MAAMVFNASVTWGVIVGMTWLTEGHWSATDLWIQNGLFRYIVVLPLRSTAYPHFLVGPKASKALAATY
jgi:hypothetical protein